MKASVILTTYNQPRQLELVLWGYAVQTRRDFQVVVADDGSGPETAEVIARVRAETGLDLLHVWHEDRGFRKTEILNRAVLVSSGEYLIFSDGDCIPRRDFMDVHLRLAEPGCFLSGGYLKLPEGVSARITVDDVRAGRVAELGWLRAQGWRPGRHALRLLRSRALAGALDALTPTGATWNGHNASTWKEAVVAVNGFDLEMGYGGLDRALGELLENAGVRGKQIRYRAPCLHLWHRRPYADPVRWQRNREIRARIRREGITRTERGIAEVAAGLAERGDAPSEGGVS
ncbi:MAG TPA: glycosyltransferase family 2 protein [Longimicrobiaceae bacterium]|nr:glycosyltransferase family 2 protein [Longimicrobiaceae bacterium]